MQIAGLSVMTKNLTLGWKKIPSVHVYGHIHVPLPISDRFYQAFHSQLEINLSCKYIQVLTVLKVNLPLN